MTVSLKHAFQSAKADGTDTSIVRPSDWNAEHVLTQATGKLLGRTSAGTGATEEITAGSGLTLGSGTLSADVTSVAGRTGAVTLAVADVSDAAPLASPALTGTPTAPTASVSTNTTQIATTAFTISQISNDSPTKSGTGATGTWGISVTGNSATATKLSTGRTISLTGDVDYTSGSFDGSANVTGTATLANSGVTAGTYTFSTITVDAKGRVTSASSGTNPSFPSGTAMLFAQTAAPTGWTKSTTHNNKALRVVSGTASSGGTVAFTTAFASQAVSGTVGNTTLTESQIPSHTHTYVRPQLFDEVNTGSGTSARISQTANTGATGGGGSHTHSFTGTAIDLAVQYVDVIIATKD